MRGNQRERERRLPRRAACSGGGGGFVSRSSLLACRCRSNLPLWLVVGGPWEFRVESRAPFQRVPAHLSMLHRGSSRRSDPLAGLGAIKNKRRHGNGPEFEGLRGNGIEALVPSRYRSSREQRGQQRASHAPLPPSFLLLLALAPRSLCSSRVGGGRHAL